MKMTGPNKQKSLMAVVASGISAFVLLAGILCFSPCASAEGKPLPPAPLAPTAKCNCFTFDATKSYDVDGQKLTVFWDLGDGKASDKPVVTHCYSKVGPYDVTLTVKDTSGQICDSGVASTKVYVNFPPIAKIGDITSCLVNEPIQFDGSGSTSSNGVLSYHWNFGDGESAEGARVSHAYKKGGNYLVILTVNDSSGSECGMASGSIVAKVNSRPEAVINVR